MIRSPSVSAFATLVFLAGLAMPGAAFALDLSLGLEGNWDSTSQHAYATNTTSTRDDALIGLVASFRVDPALVLEPVLWFALHNGAGDDQWGLGLDGRALYMVATSGPLSLLVGGDAGFMVFAKPAGWNTTDYSRWEWHLSLPLALELQPVKPLRIRLSQSIAGVQYRTETTNAGATQEGSLETWFAWDRTRPTLAVLWTL